ncbi:hypothetical protein Tco_0873336, partial [Tanacetum coccineum]
MTINSNLPPQIHEARVETLKKENVKDENLHSMDKEFENRLDGTLCIRRRIVPMARYGSMHHHLGQQVLDVSKDEGRLPEAIWFTSTTRNTPLEMGKYSHGFYHKTTKDNKKLQHDLGPEDPQTPPVPQDEDQHEPMFVHAHDPDYVPEPIYPDNALGYSTFRCYPDLGVLQIGIRAKVIENQGADDEEKSKRGIPWVIVLGYDGLPMQPVALPSPDYIPGPEDPQTPPVPQDEDEREPMFDENEDEEDEDEEEEHLAPADSVVVVPTDEPTSISLPPEAEVERLLAMTTPSPSPPISLSPPSARERLARCTAPPAHSSPLPVPLPLLPSSGCPTQIQTLRIASTQALIDAVTAALPSPPLPPLPPSLYIPPPVDRRDDIPESEQP